MKPLRDALAWIGLLTPLCYLALQWHNLPPTVPSHFGLSGHPNAYSSRSTLWVLIVLSIAIFTLLSVLVRYPHSLNLPTPQGSPDRPRQEVLGIELIHWLRLELAWLFAWLIWSICRVATHNNTGLGLWFTFAPIAIVLLTIGIFLTRMLAGPKISNV